jgi:carbamate kinase
MLVVMALGGTTLLRPGEPEHADAQPPNIAAAARAIAAVARQHAVVVTHGSGLEGGRAAGPPELGQATSPYALQMLQARSEGMIGALIEQALDNEMPGKKIARLDAEVVVRLLPVGPRYADTHDGRRFAAALGWMVVQDGKGFRRCVPSPEPARVVGLNSINALIEAGVLVICACGQGTAAMEAEFELRKSEAIIETDLAAALLAEQVGADLLMLLTDAESVEVDWRTGAALPLGGATTAAALRRISFAPGLVGPKVEAACRFVESTGKRAAIGALSQASEILQGDRGVQVTAPRLP